MNTLLAGSSGMIWVIIVVLFIGTVAGVGYWGSGASTKVLTATVSEPLGGARMAAVEISTGAGNLTLDRLAGGEPLLVSGTVQYSEKQGEPTRLVETIDGRTQYSLRSGDSGRPWYRFPWTACNGATEWQLHLNPAVALDVTAHSGGGNVKLNLAAMTIVRVVAGTGGGNMDVVLPDGAVAPDVAAKSGAGNVTVALGRGLTGSGSVNADSGAGNVVVHVPSGVAARIHATTGMGKVTVDPRFSQVDGGTYQSPDYDGATNRVEITAHSGAGNVTVATN